MRLQANGDVDQAATGAITALNLGVFTAVGDIDLCLADNAVSGTFGATATTGGIELHDTLTFTPGAVTAVGGLFSGANGFTIAANGNFTLISDSSLTVNAALALPSTTGTVRLRADGDITQTVAISAGTLVVVTSAGKIDLENSRQQLLDFGGAGHRQCDSRYDHHLRFHHHGS